ncbi:MAG: hypothetical protein ACFFHV_22265 [Promethearchaeota archaeon]
MAQIKIIDEKVVPLSYIIDNKIPLNDKNILSEVFLKIFASERSIESAYYKALICTSDGEPVPLFSVEHIYSKNRTKTRDLNEVVLYKRGLADTMNLIQTGSIGYFSSVEMFAQEKAIQYSSQPDYFSYHRYGHSSGPPPGITPINDTHYYLDLILGAPGKRVKLSNNRKIKACKSCDAMLLRFSYNWVVQRDDFKQKKCPYCSNTLKIIERDRKYVQVELDYKSEGCQITGTNNQIGILYHGIPIKTTVKVAALRNFLMNYQNLFPGGVIGPLDIRINIVKSRKGFTFLESAQPSIIMEKNIDWRPVTLFPEDLIAL